MQRSFKLTQPRKWPKPKNHRVDCYCCTAAFHAGKHQTKTEEFPTQEQDEGECSSNVHRDPEPAEAIEEGAEYGCKNFPDKFCFVCGELIKKDDKRYAVAGSENFKKAYEEYFRRKIVDLDKPWVPRFSCAACFTPLVSEYTF